MEHKQSTSPDYARYTIAELEDVLANIDRNKYAQRYADAKAMLEQKLRESPNTAEPEQVDEDDLAQKPKWSETHITTRISIAALLLLIFTSVPFVISEFMTAQSWLEQTSIWIWALSAALGALWITSLIKDEKFGRYLTRNWRGKLTAAFMPLLFTAFSFITIDNTLPLFLHNLNKPQVVSNTMQYRKVSSSKHCHHKVEIVETKELQRGKLCMSESMRNSLPESGQITVIGTRSQFGMLVKGFKPLR